MTFFFFKDTLKKTTGIIIITVGILFLAVGLFALLSGKKEDLSIGFILSGLSLTMIIPGLKLFKSGMQLTKLEESLKQLAALIKTYRRISLTEISKKFNISEMEAQKLINTAIDLNLITGNMDRNTGEFFISESLGEIKKLSYCPNCGAGITQIIHEGETGKCTVCGSLIN